MVPKFTGYGYGLEQFRKWWKRDGDLLLAEYEDGMATLKDIVVTAHGEGFRIGAAWEREECARLVEDQDVPNSIVFEADLRSAKAIRARGKEEKCAR